MDFALSEEQEALRGLAREILENEVSLETLKAIEATDDWFHAELWSKLADANLLGLAVPEAQGGMGYGLFELCLLLQEVGRVLAPVPALPALALGGLGVARGGSEAQRERWLRPLAHGEAILSAALVDADATEVTAPATRARRDGEGFVLDGRKRLVPAAHLAARVIVPAATDEGLGLFLVDPQAPGVSLVRQRVSSFEPLAELTLAGVRVEADDLLGGDARGGAELAGWLEDAARVALAATQLGVSERSIEITTGYLKEREQFGAPLGSFAAVQQRQADGYIDLEALRWTTWRAAWKLDRGQPAHREATVAKFWAAEAGTRIANTSQHQHGGMGVDRDYPIHRYFLWTKSLELSLGSATPQLARLGRDMARTGPQELA